MDCSPTAGDRIGRATTSSSADYIPGATSNNPAGIAKGGERLASLLGIDIQAAFFG